jgi:hypothetical protein
MQTRGIAPAGHVQALAAAFAETDRVTRANSRTFYFATTLLLPAARRAIRA